MGWPSVPRFAACAIVLGFTLSSALGATPVRVLAIVAHPDDEYCFAATLYRLTRELGAHADQVAITNGEAGFHYSQPAEKIYGQRLTEEAVGKKELPEIRRLELEESGKVLGVSAHVFLDQPDSGKVTDVATALKSWDEPKINTRLDSLLREGHYDLVLTLLPMSTTHGHHKAAAVLALEAVARLSAESRPVVLGCWDESRHHPARDAEQADDIRAAQAFRETPGQPLTRLLQPTPLAFDRETAFGPENKLNYQIYVNWMIAAHKSQGLFQTFVLRDDTENFSLFAVNSPAAAERARSLFREISSATGGPAQVRSP